MLQRVEIFLAVLGFDWLSYVVDCGLEASMVDVLEQWCNGDDFGLVWINRWLVVGSEWSAFTGWIGTALGLTMAVRCYGFLIGVNPFGLTVCSGVDVTSRPD